MMSRVLKLILGAALALCMGAPAPAAADKPLVLESGKVKQLPASTTLQLNASGTGAASINIPHGTAPTSPTNGDCWTTTAGLFCRVNGSTAGPYGTGTGGNIESKDEGSSLTAATTSINFVGGGVTATNVSGAVTVTVPGGLVLISGYSASGSTAVADFTSIPGTFKDLVVVINGRNGDAAFGTNLTVTVNNLTTSIYDKQRHYVTNTTNSADQALAQTSFSISALAGTSATSGMAGSGVFEIIDYANTTFWKNLFATATSPDSVSNNFYRFDYSGRVRDTGAVSRVTLTSATNMVSGTTIRLYGRP